MVKMTTVYFQEDFVGKDHYYYVYSLNFIYGKYCFTL